MIWEQLKALLQKSQVHLRHEFGQPFAAGAGLAVAALAGAGWTDGAGAAIAVGLVPGKAAGPGTGGTAVGKTAAGAGGTAGTGSWTMVMGPATVGWAGAGSVTRGIAAKAEAAVDNIAGWT